MADAAATPKPSSAGVRADDGGSKRKSIAVVGSGIAGLAAAHLLARKHKVTVFERAAALGMDAHSLDCCGARMDIPLRVFSEAYYPNLCKLYTHLGIKYGNADYSFCCLGEASPRAYFRYVNVFVSGMAIPLPTVLLSIRSLPKYLRLAAQFLHFMRYSPGYMAAEGGSGITLSDFLDKHDYSEEFAAELLYPMLSIVCTCSFKAVQQYPAQLIVDYFANKYGLSGAQCRAHGGTREVVAQLTSNVERVVLSAQVVSVTPDQDGASVSWTDLGAPHSKLKNLTECEHFDEVVLATQANVSCKILSSSNSAQVDALAKFEYERYRVLLHTDETLMPSNRRDWSPLNISLDHAHDAACVTVWMNHIDAHLSSDLQRDLFQTWNPHREPAADTLKVDYTFERPVVTAASVAAMEQLQRSQGEKHVWLVGAYSRYSMPLLENGVKSALEVASRLGIDVSDVAFEEPLSTAKSKPLPSLMARFAIPAVAIAAATAAAVRFFSYA